MILDNGNTYVSNAYGKSCPSGAYILVEDKNNK